MRLIGFAAGKYPPFRAPDRPSLAYNDVFPARNDVLAELDSLAQAQVTDITGMAADKDQEERELDDICIKYGRSEALCYRRMGDDTNAAKVDLTPSRWRRQRRAVAGRRHDARSERQFIVQFQQQRTVTRSASQRKFGRCVGLGFAR